MYKDTNHLQDWAEQVGGNVETLPPAGTYDISSILDAKYFFG
jgi:DNA-directed RNA polymerase